MSLDDIARVTITAQTATPSRVGFGTPCIPAYFEGIYAGAELAREYTSVSAMITDGFGANSAAVRGATAAFAQNPKPTKIVVARTESDEKQKLTITPVATNIKNSYEYTVYVNNLEATYTSDATATAAEICAGLKVAIDALAQSVTVTDNTTSFDIESDTVDDTFSFYVLERQILTQENVTPDGGIVADLTAIRLQNDDWYTVHPTNLGEAVLTALAVHVETLVKGMITSSADDAIYDSGSTTDIAAVLNTAGYARTMLMYHPKALVQYPGIAWAGKCLPKDPGSITWKFKTLAGVDSVVLTTTEEKNIEAKKCNHYQTVSGIAITQQGYSSAGEFFDITRGLDFMRARLQEYIFGSLANADKIPFTDPGVGVVEADVRAVLKLCVGNGILAASPEPTVTVPKVADVSTANKANRLLPDVLFDGTLAGAIHAVEVDGSVTV